MLRLGYYMAGLTAGGAALSPDTFFLLTQAFDFLETQNGDLAPPC
jgi:hypothetical protein